MTGSDPLVEDFEKNRTRLRSVAYRMLGSLTEADDALQDAWLRSSRAGTDGVENMDGWLTTIVAHVCLGKLRSRTVRREDPVGAHVPDPVISGADGTDPEDSVLLSDSVGLALQVVLETLSPAERLAFVLHDLFGLPFEEIAPVVGRTPAAARQLASRARRRVRDAHVQTLEPDIARQREVVDAFFAAAHLGDLDALVAVLDPDVVVRTDGGPGRPDASSVLQGAAAVAGRTVTMAQASAPKRPVLVNGAAGVIITVDGQPRAVMGFSISGGRISEINAIVDPERLRQIDLAVLGG